MNDKTTLSLGHYRAACMTVYTRLFGPALANSDETQIDIERSYFNGESLETFLNLSGDDVRLLLGA